MKVIGELPLARMPSPSQGSSTVHCRSSLRIWNMSGCGRLALLPQRRHEEVGVGDAGRRHERLLHVLDAVAAVDRADGRLGRARPGAALVPGLAPGDRAQPFAARDARR